MSKLRSTPDPSIPFATELLACTDPLVETYTQDGIFLVVGAGETKVIEGKPRNYAGIIIGKGAKLTIDCKVGTEENPVLYLYSDVESSILIHRDGALYYSCVQWVQRDHVPKHDPDEKQIDVHTFGHPHRFYPCKENCRISKWWKDNVLRLEDEDVEVSNPARSFKELIHRDHATPPLALLDFARVDIETNYSFLIGSHFDSSYADKPSS